VIIVDILKEMMIEAIEGKIVEMKDRAKIDTYNAEQLQIIVDKLNNNEELSSVEKWYIDIFFE
jgi:ribosome assembly protein YihI (activator of Der GTPase)